VRRCLACAATFGGDDWTCPSCGWAPAERDRVIAFAPELAATAEAEGGFEPDAFESLARLEEDSFWFGARNDLILWALRTYAPQAGSFLEIGCGTGFVLRAISRAMPQLRLAGSELFTAGLQHAAVRIPDAELMQMDARRIPFDEEFDAIGAFDVLEHVDEDHAVLAECRRALNPGGALFVTVPQHPWMWSSADDYAHHVRRYTRRQLVAGLNAAGLEPVRVTSFVTLLLPLMALSRVAERRARRPYDPIAEHERSSRLRRPLEATMRMESASIRRGVSLAAGGSLLAVAVRG
jgi:SAM-dependent methyltransferase